MDEEEVTSIDGLCHHISEDNDRRIEGMSEEGIKREQRDIIEHFGRDPGEDDDSPISSSASSLVHC